MSTARRQYEHGTIINMTVAAGQTTTIGHPVALASATTVQTAYDDTAFGVALATAAAAAAVDILCFGPIVPMVVGTGGSTVGVVQQLVADGVTDAAAHNSDGTGNDVIVGMAMETGVATAMIGVCLFRGNRGF
jgi:hypothetical protein